MWRRSKNHIEDGPLDCCGDELLRALLASEAEINTAATSPFLLRRIRARIAAEERARAEARNPWRALLAQARHALPIVAVLAVMALGALWYVPPANNLADEPPSILFAGIAAQDEDELVSSLVDWETSETNSRKEKQ